MTLTRKHFKGIADAVKETKREHPEHVAVDVLVQKLASYLATTNPAFNRAKFLEACYL